MKRTFSYSFFSLITSVFLFHTGATAQVFPRGAIIVEQRTLPSEPDRALALWMLRPERSEPIPEDDPYTCPDETRGNAYHGPTRVSLINLTERRIINTINIRDPQRRPEGSVANKFSTKLCGSIDELITSTSRVVGTFLQQNRSEGTNDHRTD
jgi:hypothetical protein